MKMLSFKKNMFQLIWTIITIVFLLVSGIITSQPLYKTFCTIISIIMLFFLIKGSPFSFICGLVYYPFFSVICYVEKVYGACLLNIFLSIPVQIIGLIRYFNKSKTKNKKVIELQILSKLCLIVVIVFSLILCFILYFVTKKIGSISPVFDSLSMSFSIISLVLLSMGKIEHWIFNILANLFTAILWGSVIKANITNLNIFFVTIIFTIYGVLGLINWLRLYKSNKKNNSN